MTKRRKPLAAIDIGTNSVHLVVVDADTATGKFKVLDREKEIVRLGGGSKDMKRLSPAAMRRGIEALDRFRRIAETFHAPIRAIATSAVREAANQGEFLKRVRSECGLKVDIVSGAEEARLIYLGILQALPVYDHRVLLIDVGGGSTEFLVGKKRFVEYDASLKMGAVRLTLMFFGSSGVNQKSVRRCREFIRGLMNPVTRAIGERTFETVVGSSGTILTLAAMIRAVRGGDASARLNNFTFSREELSGVTEKILGARSDAERSKLAGMDPRRADIIVAGALIVDEAFNALAVRRMTVSEYALREGIILDFLEQQRARKRHHRLDNIRYASVIHLAASVSDDQRHAQHVSALALRLFDQTKRLHGMGDAERGFLEAAAIMHEVGLFISHDQHHRHSYYLIRNAELLGFTENEKEIIANIARYHRKSHPKLKHEGFQTLSSDEQMTVRRLAGMLRIADGLDRTHSSSVADVHCKVSRSSVLLSITAKRGASFELELWGADRKKALFEESFGRSVKFNSSGRNHQ